MRAQRDNSFDRPKSVKRYLSYLYRAITKKMEDFRGYADEVPFNLYVAEEHTLPKFVCLTLNWGRGVDIGEQSTGISQQWRVST